jgi:hypothetical protein
VGRHEMVVRGLCVGKGRESDAQSAPLSEEALVSYLKKLSFSFMSWGQLLENWSAPNEETLGLMPPVPRAMTPNALHEDKG